MVKKIYEDETSSSLRELTGCIPNMCAKPNCDCINVVEIVVAIVNLVFSRHDKGLSRSVRPDCLQRTDQNALYTTVSRLVNFIIEKGFGFPTFL